MSVVIKTANLKYKNSDGEYVGINAIAEDTIEGKIAAIESAGTTAVNNVISASTDAINSIISASTAAVNNIQTKGAETLASIPNDYISLSTRIDNIINDAVGNGNTNVVWSADKSYKEMINLQNAIENVPIGVDIFNADVYGDFYIHPAHIRGKLSAVGAWQLDNNTWVTKSYIPIKFLRTLVNNTSNNIYVDYFDDNYTFVKYDTVSSGTTYNFYNREMVQNYPDYYVRLYIRSDSLDYTLKIRNPFVYRLNTELCQIFPSDRGYPNIDTINNTITFKAYTRFYYGDIYTITEDENIILSDGNDNHIALIVVLDKVTKAFSCVSYPIKLDNYIPVAMIYKRAADHKHKIAITCPFSIDGEFMGHENSKTNLATIFPSKNDSINIDTKNHIFTIPAASTIFWGNSYYLVPSGGLSLELDTSNSRFAKKILFNTTNYTLSETNYNTLPAYNEVVIALLALDNNFNFNKIAITAPYTVDGIPYNILTNKADINKNIRSVNHRGYNIIAPENTLPAFKLSKKMGFDWIETDVQFTSDNVPIILHDSTINRTARNSDGTTIEESIAIANITYNEALQYDFGIWKNASYAGTKIPTFEQVISLARAIGLKVRIELKNVLTEKIQDLVDIIEKYNMIKNIEFVSFDHSLITYINTNYHYFAIGLIQDTIDDTLLSTVDSLMTTRNDLTVSVNVNQVNNTATKYKQLADKGVIIDVYTISNETQILNADSHVTSFTTNGIDCGLCLYNYYIN